MTTPRVIELPRRLEPTGQDTFNEQAATTARQEIQARTQPPPYTFAKEAVKAWDRDTTPSANPAIHQGLGEQALSDVAFEEAIRGLELQPAY